MAASSAARGVSQDAIRGRQRLARGGFIGLAFGDDDLTLRPALDQCRVALVRVEQEQQLGSIWQRSQGRVRRCVGRLCSLHLGLGDRHSRRHIRHPIVQLVETIRNADRGKQLRLGHQPRGARGCFRGLDRQRLELRRGRVEFVDQRGQPLHARCGTGNGFRGRRGQIAETALEHFGLALRLGRPTTGELGHRP